MKELDSSDEWGNRVAKGLEEVGLEMVYPIFGKNRLLGFLAFGSDSSEAIQLLGGQMIWDTLIHESALALENAILREENCRSQAMLCQVDRLRSLEVMADGLTQELHHPLVSMKAFVQVANMRQHDGEFMDRLDRILGEDLGKIDQLTQEIREYVKPLSKSLGARVHIHEVIDSCLLFIASNPSYHHIMIEKILSPHLPMIRMDRQELMQAIFNGLLFLLKDSENLHGTLMIETHADSQVPWQNWIQVDIRWKSHLPTSSLMLISVESVAFDEYFEKNHDHAMTQGVILASQIIQRSSGNFRLLGNKQSMVGFQIQLPLNIAYEHEHHTGSFPLSSLSRLTVDS